MSSSFLQSEQDDIAHDLLIISIILKMHSKQISRLGGISERTIIENDSLIIHEI